MKGMRMSGPQRQPGFTLVELILVIFIMLLLTIMTVPLFSQFVKTSRVQQTANIVMTTITRARMEATRSRKMTAIFFGDDVTQCLVTPTPGILPPRGRIEIWNVKEGGNDEEGVSASSSPFNNQGDWYPYKDQDRNVSAEPITYPDGVRILAGQFAHGGGPWYGFGWQKDWHPQYNPVPDGELKRHIIAFSRNGHMPGWYDGLNSWWNVLVFDTTTGEHVIISVGDWMTTAKPRVLPFQLNTLWAPSGTAYTINSKADLAKYIEK